jgi:hypothetical protein
MIVLKVPYADKDAAKALGARWDAKRKTWYVPDGAAAAPFERWLPPAGASQAEAGKPGRVDSYAGKAVAGEHYVELEHDCNPFAVCPQCGPVLEASGWAAARRHLLEAIAALK